MWGGGGGGEWGARPPPLTPAPMDATAMFLDIFFKELYAICILRENHVYIFFGNSKYVTSGFDRVTNCHLYYLQFF